MMTQPLQEGSHYVHRIQLSNCHDFVHFMQLTLILLFWVEKTMSEQRKPHDDERQDEEPTAGSFSAASSTQSHSLSQERRELHQALKEIDPELSIDESVEDFVIRLVNKFSEDILEGASRIRQLAKNTTPAIEGEDDSSRVSREDIYVYLASVWPQLLPPDSSYMELANTHPRWNPSTDPVAARKEKDLANLARTASSRFEQSRRSTDASGQAS
eukprot:gb/GECG01006425.1/.p1 GENE.gb/GECG01006425.1/~~gb/GECG01006425.1/.p1  ORF type:complete len:214 (+),score=29.00 gb/GECG01006425.1/:1-642(+)